MELTPKAIGAMSFPLVRKGYDPDQVRAFLQEVARGVEDLQNRVLQAEARARLSTPAPAMAVAVEGGAEAQSMESITRMLTLAQRTADATVGEARDEAEGLRREAEQRAESTLAEARARADNLVAASEAEATRQADLVNARARSESDALAVRREQLLNDIERLRSHVLEQRERIAATVDVLRRSLEHPDGLQAMPTPEVTDLSTTLPPPGDVAAAPPPGVGFAAGMGTAAGGLTDAAVSDVVVVDAVEVVEVVEPTDGPAVAVDGDADTMVEVLDAEATLDGAEGEDERGASPDTMT